ncbi:MULTISPECIES: acyl-CoA dehydrogenase family protein [Pseudofrankia]|uniref:acyl-CoA dehydrogenase family protein n=1 Tax=Pseudofrankia TaxID=2994363 RepID=UPI000234D0C4|nr:MULTISPECIES: acyl-CoA dehydrogenase family protein [Pseudofrankia]OHV34793.1 acyl-CoA dehydrogenase [Pseudofrankia sp. EUN1h]
MDLALDETALAARDLVRAVLARHPGLAPARAAQPLGHDPGLWDDLRAAGLPGLAVGAEHGGGGAGLHAAAAAALELGRVLAPVPFAEHTAAARLLAATAPDHPHLAAVVSGELVATLAPRVRCGVGTAVPAGAVAGVVLAIVDETLTATRTDPPGVATPNQGDLPLADRPLGLGSPAAVVLGQGPAAVAAFGRARREWLTLAAAWLAGLGDGALDLATRWVRERVQFGVPIGSFQGVQHGLADLPGLVDGAALLAREAAWCQDAGRRSLTGASGPELALMALHFATDAARATAGRLVQYHGGLGVAVEHDAQLFYRRASAYPLLAGAPRHLLRELGQRLLGAAATDGSVGTVDGSIDAGEGAGEGEGFGHRPEVGAFAAEVRAFLATWLTDEIRQRMRRTGTMHVPALHRAMAARGWLAAPTPGGRATRSVWELSALFRELEIADAPYHGIATTMIVAGVLDQLAGPALRTGALPRLLAGEAIAVLGYSEPGSGSDVAAARTRAEPVGDPPTAWRINGQKMWTTLAHEAAYCFLLARTNQDVPKHRGLTMFLVPLDTPGITIQPIHTIGDERTNIVFYDDVVIPDENRIGEVDGGWRVMAVGLSMERGVMGGTGMLEPLVHDAVAWAARTGPDGSRPGDDPAVLETVARARVDAEVAFLLTRHTAFLSASGQSPAVAGTVAKLFASTAYQRAAGELRDVAGTTGILRGLDHDALATPGPADAGGTGGALEPAAGGQIERAARHSAMVTIQGGTTEIARNLVAEQRLGLPKARGGTRAAGAVANSAPAATVTPAGVTTA